MTQAALQFVDEPPDFSVWSALTIAPGLWRMRNGHTARIVSLMQLPYESGGQRKSFPVWKGECVECREAKTWNINGTYAAVGKHPLDIVGRA